MKYHELKVKPHRSTNRPGRGISAGQGKTAGRGTKGQNARAGSSKKPGFSGGQNPLMQQLPKLPGFRSYRLKPENVFTDQISTIQETKINAQILYEQGMVSSPNLAVKLLKRGDKQLSRKLTVSLPAASASAIDALQEAGGTYTKVPRIARTANTKDDN